MKEEDKKRIDKVAKILSDELDRVKAEAQSWYNDWQKLHEEHHALKTNLYNQAIQDVLESGAQLTPNQYFLIQKLKKP